jgi:thiamine-phosphate pyrophosphorylase
VTAIDFSVYVILDPRAIPAGREPLEVAEAALRGGAGVLQLREKRPDITDDARLRLAARLAALCAEYDAAFIVNDRLDIAREVGADGVHLGPGDMPVDEARRRAPSLVIGGSAGTPARAAALEEQGADYLGCGAVYRAAPSKPDASDPRGPAFLQKIRARVSIPIVGIGGIDAGNAAAVIERGADGVAVIRSVVSSDDPEAATRELRAVVEAAR